MTIHDRFERLVCDCTTCRAACKTMPGSLHPEDITRIQEHLGLDNDGFAEWIMDNLVASDGAVVVKDGSLSRIVSITPRQTESGSCVFYRDDGCQIHAVAPFGCSHFWCREDPQAEDKAYALYAGAATCESYAALWAVLRAAGAVAQGTTMERRAKWMEAIKHADV